MEEIKKLVLKMIEDKRKVNDYIKEHGSLDGFNDSTINFAKPL